MSGIFCWTVAAMPRAKISATRPTVFLPRRRLRAPAAAPARLPTT